MTPPADDLDAAPPPARVANLTDIDEARVYAEWLAVQKAGRVPRHVGFAVGPLRALELATASGDELLERLVALAIGCDRPGWWLHDYGPRGTQILDAAGNILEERAEPSRCPADCTTRAVCVRRCGRKCGVFDATAGGGAGRA
jgi:hypothetical protein